MLVHNVISAAQVSLAEDKYSVAVGAGAGAGVAVVVIIVIVIVMCWSIMFFQRPRYPLLKTTTQ